MAPTVSEKFPKVGFGTSGLRAFVDDITTECVYAYVSAFLKSQPDVRKAYLAYDLRPSSPKIMLDVYRCLLSHEIATVNLGTIPTPALAFNAIENKALGIMVTGSHIPFDRNGIKFYATTGEITKSEESFISTFPIASLDFEQALIPKEAELPDSEKLGLEKYQERAFQAFPNLNLSGKTIGVYQHSAVGRDFLIQVLEDLGAKVIPLGRSDVFIPIDTEAVSLDDLKTAKDWIDNHQLDALFSTDGDGDRPWVCDEKGEFIRGDILGILTARAIGARAIAAPVNVNTALELSESFEAIERTKIGSPFVIAGMKKLSSDGMSAVAGFEANGGFLTQTKIGALSALPTRDSLVPILALMSLSVQTGLTLSGLKATLPQRFTDSNRLQNTPTELSQRFVEKLILDKALQERFFSGICSGEITEIQVIDGARFQFNHDEIAHFRPSGNAPELRCYAEANTVKRAGEIVELCLARVSKFL